MKHEFDPHPKVTQYFDTVDGIVRLFHPYLEGAVHDLRSGRIVALFNSYSRRQLGDISAIYELGIPTTEFPDVFDPYYKMNWDGRNLKCVSITIRDDAGIPVGLICLNFALDFFDGVHSDRSEFLSIQAGALNPVEIFSADWKQRVNAFMASYADEKDLPLETLPKDQKRELVITMYEHGFFNIKKSEDYVGRKLGVSRAVIYSYLEQGK
ncbi:MULTISPECIES: helix-turn-helix transcriptional regulator [unclassified Frankia]|uniref:helix-turn-helix transcriptional regulator n=1 Tax=unclassified Frankia TaxID=2632575 RepID=UPI002AD28B7F|nr:MULTISPECIES: PAS domain-containing protein [unclassified Frankia]